MSAVSTWSTTAASNNSSPPDGWPEGMAPAAINDCAREMMAAIKTWYDEELTFHGYPQNAQEGNYTLVLGDNGKHIYRTVDAPADNFLTIPLNSSVAFPLGTAVKIVNLGDTVAISPSVGVTLTWLTSGSTGLRGLARNGIAEIIKIGTNSWVVSGSGLS